MPFHDSFHRRRNVLAPNEVFGTRSCYSGFEGAVDEHDKFISCHMNIYEPTFFVENTMSIIVWGALALLFLFWTFIKRKRRRHSKYMTKRFARREGVVPTKHAFAFNTEEKNK
jgi:hypothetical protein